METDDLEFVHFFKHHVLDVFLEVDGRVARSLRSLFIHPGALARDFVQGRRQRISSPIRLYLAIYLLHAFIGALFFHDLMTIPERARLLDPTGFLTKLIAHRSEVDWTSELLQVRLAERTHWVGELGTFLIFVGVAGVQSCVFFRLRRTYVEHLTLALTVSAWFLSMLILGDVLLITLGRTTVYTTQLVAQSWIALVGLPIYWAVAIRKFYGVGWWFAGVSGLTMAIGTSALASLFNVLFLALVIITA